MAGPPPPPPPPRPSASVASTGNSNSSDLLILDQTQGQPTTSKIQSGRSSSNGGSNRTRRLSSISRHPSGSESSWSPPFRPTSPSAESIRRAMTVSISSSSSKSRNSKLSNERSDVAAPEVRIKSGSGSTPSVQNPIQPRSSQVPPWVYRPPTSSSNNSSHNNLNTRPTNPGRHQEPLGPPPNPHIRRSTSTPTPAPGTVRPRRPSQQITTLAPTLGPTPEEPEEPEAEEEEQEEEQQGSARSPTTQNHDRAAGPRRPRKMPTPPSPPKDTKRRSVAPRKYSPGVNARSQRRGPTTTKTEGSSQKVSTKGGSSKAKKPTGVTKKGKVATSTTTKNKTEEKYEKKQKNKKKKGKQGKKSTTATKNAGIGNIRPQPRARLQSRPRARANNNNNARRNQHLLSAVEGIQRQSVPPPRPTHGRATRASGLAIDSKGL